MRAPPSTGTPTQDRVKACGDPNRGKLDPSVHFIECGLSDLPTLLTLPKGKDVSRLDVRMVIRF